jgi:hypothetical protein
MKFFFATFKSTPKLLSSDVLGVDIGQTAYAWLECTRALKNKRSAKNGNRKVPTGFYQT